MRKAGTVASGGEALIGSLDGAAAVRQRRTTQELVVEFLRDAILSNRLPGGSHLIQDKIATELNVSRVPIREALLQLEAEGLVRMEAHRGASVVWLSPEQIEEIFEIRATLMAAALRKVLPNLTDDQIRRLRQIARKQENEQNMAVRARLNASFYSTLFENLNRPRLRTMMEKLEREVERYLMPLDRPHMGHDALVDACERKDVEAAVNLLSHHLNRVCERVVERVQGMMASGEIGFAGSATRRRRTPRTFDASMMSGK